MKVTIAMLVVYVLTLVIEVPIWLYLLIKRYGAASAIGPGAIEAIFVALMIVFIFYGGRGMRWSYVGAMVVGIVHAILSASIVLMEPWGEPLDFFDAKGYLECLDAMTAQGRHVCHAKGRGYAPKAFAEMPQANGMTARAFQMAQERLFAAGNIENVPYGPASKGTKCIARKA